MKTKINGIQLAYELQEGSGMPIVLLHGFAMNRSVWHEMATTYLADKKLILPDLRGHGESDASDGPYPMELLAADLAGLINYLEIKSAIICGHSMGGYAALAFAEQYPQMLAGLGLITTNVEADDEVKRAGRYAQINEINIKGSIAVADSLAPRLSKIPVVIAWAHQLISKANPNGLIGALEGMAARPDRTHLLPKINVPAIVVAGELDQITDVNASKIMASTLPQGYYYGIKNAGHMPSAEAPGELAEAILTLCNRVAI